MRPERAVLRSERAALRPERADLRPGSPDLRPQRLSLKPERLRGGRADKWMDKRTNKNPPVFYKILSPSELLPKRAGLRPGAKKTRL